MKTTTIKTATGNYVAVINGVETFISADGSKSNPVQNPCFAHLSKHNCRPIELEVETISEIPAAFEAHLKADEAAAQAYLNSDAYLKEKADRIAARETAAAERQARIINEYQQLIESCAGRPIPTTVQNLGIVLRYLNTQNWGGWNLPAMSIGYSAHQYDCEGTLATTIELDKAISDEDGGIVREKKFKVGGKRGHLEKYQRV